PGRLKRRQLALGEAPVAQHTGRPQERLAACALDLAPALQRPQAHLEVRLVGVGGGRVDPRGSGARPARGRQAEALQERHARAAPRQGQRGCGPDHAAPDHDDVGAFPLLTLAFQTVYDRTVHMYTKTREVETEGAGESEAPATRAAAQAGDRR